ncbi:MAG: hypothetical protein U0132_12110 [Gemmatimonadaceae bacterium]
MRPLRILAVLTLIGVTVPSASAQTDSASSLVRQARQLNNQGKSSEALAVYQQAMALAPTMYDAHAGAGAVLDLMGRYEEARKHLTQAIALATPQQKSGALRAMVISYLFDRRGAEGIPYGKQAVDLAVVAGDFNAAAEITNEVARVLIESNALDEAQAWYDQGYQYALKQTALPDSAKDLWEFRYENALARVAARRGNGQEALTHVNAAKAAFARGRIPDQAPFVSYLAGYVAFYQKDYRTAIAELERGNQRDPFILALLAQAYEQSGNASRAMDYWKQVLTYSMHNPTNAYARPLAQAKVK